MFDFGANIRDEGGVKGRNNKGLVTYDRRIKKDAFYMYKAHWSDEKFVHITGKRFIDRCEERIQIKIYSNCSKVTLYVNENELESQESDEKVFIFEDVVLQDGINTVKVIAAQDTLEVQDTARFNKVPEPNTSYNAPGGEVGGEVENWFEMPDLSDVAVEELDIPEDVYSTRCTYREILDNEEAKVIFRKYYGKMDEHPMFSMILGMKVDTVEAMDMDKI